MRTALPTLCLLAAPLLGQDDPRDVRAGWVLPDEGYCDQPLVARLADGTWLTVLTTGAGHEGQRGQHVVCARSSDQGRTWSAPLDIEPASRPEASTAQQKHDEMAGKLKRATGTLGVAGTIAEAGSLRHESDGKSFIGVCVCKQTTPPLLQHSRMSSQRFTLRVPLLSRYLCVIARTHCGSFAINGLRVVVLPKAVGSSEALRL